MSATSSNVAPCSSSRVAKVWRKRWAWAFLAPDFLKTIGQAQQLCGEAPGPSHVLRAAHKGRRTAEWADLPAGLLLANSTVCATASPLDLLPYPIMILQSRSPASLCDRHWKSPILCARMATSFAA